VSFSVLAVISAVALLGPALALPERWHLPVVLGELVAGIALGPTVFGFLSATDPGFSFLAEVGFALVMFVAGTHVPLRDPSLRTSAWLGLLRAVGVGVAAAVVGTVVSRVFGTGHAALYAVLMASSSAGKRAAPGGSPVVSTALTGGGRISSIMARPVWPTHPAHPAHPACPARLVRGGSGAARAGGVAGAAAGGATRAGSRPTLPRT